MRPTLPRVLGRGQTRIPACNAIGSRGRWRRAPPLHPPDSMGAYDRPDDATPIARPREHRTRRTPMTATHDLHSLGQSLWLDNITRPCSTAGRSSATSRARRHGLTSNPTIFDKAIGGSDAYDDQIAESAAPGSSPEERSSPSRSPTSPRRGPVPARVRALERRRRLRVARGLAADRLRHGRRPSPRRSACAAADRPQPVHQDPGHARGPRRDRGVDLRGRPDQRHAAVLAAPVPSPRPRRTRAASSGALEAGCRPRSSRWRRCSSAAGTPPSRTACRRTSSSSWASRSASRRTPSTWRSSHPALAAR